MKLRPISFFLLSILLSPVFGKNLHAQNDGTLHVLRPVMRTEQDKPELCLELDHPLDNDAGNIQGLRLEADGKNVQLQAQNVSVMGNTLCLSSLEYRKEYRISVSGLHGAEDEKLASAYRLSFTIPDRHPSVSFAAEQMADGVTRWGDDDPVLRAINIARAKIELYHITDPPAMAEAWHQRAQTLLAPTESAYLARHSGHLIWQGDVVLDDAPNKQLEQKLPLHAALNNTVAPGLYLVVASAPLPKTAAETELAPLAALWLMRSGLEVRALRGSDHFYALAEQKDGTPLKDVRFSVEDGGQQSLGEGKSDTDGIAIIPVSADKMANAVTLTGLAGAGDIAFADLSQKTTDLVLPGLAATMTPDKAFYMPGDTAGITFGAYDIHNHAAIPDNSHLDILRPDRSLYLSLPVPKDQNGAVRLRFSIPAGNGVWPLEWRRNDGTKLADSSFRITTNEDAPKLEVTADRDLAGEDNEIVLDLKGTSGNNRPAPYVTGHINVGWIIPDHVFAGWNDYRFGTGSGVTDNKTVNAASFVTDDKGMARLHIHLPAPPAGNAMHAAVITVISDPAAGIADPAPLQIPARPKDFIIGIKPDAADGRFSENGTARFDVIALDSNGKRRPADGLSWRIYEIGRSFEWYQTEGRWDYKPQPQQRRIAGGPLAVKTDDGTGIEWHGPVGTYRLEIISGNTALADVDFNIGWNAAAAAPARNSPLTLSASTTGLQTGQPVKIKFRLDSPAIVTGVAADDHIRAVIHQTRPAGENEITFTPSADWGNTVKFTVDAVVKDKEGAPNMQGQLTLSSASAGQTAVKNTDTQKTDLPALTVTTAFLPTIKTGDQIQLTFTFKNNASTAASYHYVFTPPADVKLYGTAGGTLNLSAGQSRNISINVNPASAGIHEIKLETTGGHNFHANYTWPVMVNAPRTGFADLAEQTLPPQQSWTKTIEKKTEEGFVFVSPQPLYDAPQLLANVLQVQAFTTEEISGEISVLRLWHGVFAQSELLPEQISVSRQRHLATRLLERQLPDGSFPPAPGKDADIASTAAALEALASSDLPIAKPAIDHASDWLKHQLNNNWFDEHQRPERAAAYNALAIADRLDAASLHYFSDTSGDKNLPPLAALQLAAAFNRINDKDKTGYWLNAAHIGNDPSGISIEFLPLLAGNPLFDTRALLPAMEKIAGDKKKVLQGIGAVNFLVALWNVQSREGIWRLNINNSEQSLKNVFVTSMQDKPAITLRNPGDKPLYVTESRIAGNAAGKDDSIARHIYKMNGSEVTGEEPLLRDETYLVTIEGAWPDDGSNSILVQDIVAPALTPASCALGSKLDVNDSLKWMEGLSISTPVTCEKLVNGVDVLLSAKDGDSKMWRIAYLAKAEFRGRFTLSPPQLRSLDNHRPAHEGRTDQWRVQ